MSQKQIAGELGVSQMQVSRLLRKLLVRLRAGLDDGQPGGPDEEPSSQGE
jgi:hypothetical protein